MTRVAVASDLRFDAAGHLTSPATVAPLVEEVRAAVVLARISVVSSPNLALGVMRGYR